MDNSLLGMALGQLLSTAAQQSYNSAANDSGSNGNESVTILPVTKNVKFLIPLDRSGLTSNDSTLGTNERDNREIPRVQDIFPSNPPEIDVRSNEPDSSEQIPLLGNDWDTNRIQRSSLVSFVGWARDEFNFIYRSTSFCACLLHFSTYVSLLLCGSDQLLFIAFSHLNSRELPVQNQSIKYLISTYEEWRVEFNERARHLESGDLYSMLSLIYLQIYYHIFPKGWIDAWLLVAVAIKMRQFYASFTFRQQPVLHWQMTKMMMRRQSERASESERERERGKKNKQTNENRRVRVCVFVRSDY